jgi:hypothetical protein
MRRIGMVLFGILTSSFGRPLKGHARYNGCVKDDGMFDGLPGVEMDGLK